MQVLIRKATAEDAGAIMALIRELALFELEPDAVITSEEVLIRDGFGPEPHFHCLLAVSEGQVIGMSFCYIRYSTWKGKRLYLEDLIVTEAWRGTGVGSQLFDSTLALARVLGCNAVCWQVLDWNTQAIEFYKAKGGCVKEGWLDMQLELE